MFEFLIEVEEAEKIVKNFHEKVPQFGGLTCFGGVLTPSSWLHENGKPENIDPKSFLGFYFWFGLNENDELTLYFETGLEYDPSNLPKEPTKEFLFTSSRMITKEYLGSQDGFLIRGTRIAEEILSKNDFQVSKREVIEAIRRFKEKFPKDSKGESFNKFPFGFYETNRFGDFSRFSNQSGLRSIGYLFAFDESKQVYIQTNRIRVVLIGIDINGNLLSNSNLGNLTQKFIILQTSWPPPPSSTNPDFFDQLKIQDESLEK